MSAQGSDPEVRRTVAAIIDATEALALDLDLGGVTIEEIAHAADVPADAVREHFGSMDGLALALAERAFEANVVYMDAAYTSSADPVEQLRAAARWYVTFHEDHPASFRLLAFPHGPGGRGGPAGVIADRIADKIQAQNVRLADALRHGIDAGMIRPVDPDRAATFLWSAWNGLVSLRWRPDHLACGREELDRLVDLAVDIISWGLLVPTPSERGRRRLRR